MKKIIIVLLAFLATSSLSAQDPTLTKGETISYLNKKIAAIVGQQEPFCSSCTNDRIRQAYIKEVEGLIEIYFSYDVGDNIYSQTYRFNPKYITSINLTVDNTAVKGLNIFLANQSGLKTTSDYDGQFWKEKNMSFLFLDTDPENFNKIKKAFLYLKKLYSADTDPFGD